VRYKNNGVLANKDSNTKFFCVAFCGLVNGLNYYQLVSQGDFFMFSFDS